MDLSKFFLLILCLFFLLFLFQSKIQKYCVTFIFFYIRLCFGFLFSFALFYFFGGESVLRDSFLFGITFFCLEIYFFIYLFFFILKQKKNY